MSRVYIAHTPYHVLLSAALEAESPGADSLLIVVRDGDGAWSAAEALRTRGALLRGVRCVALAGVRPGQYHGPRRALRLRRNVRALRALLAHEQPREVVVFNDWRPEGQYAAHLLSARGARCVAAEDGLAAYGDEVRRTPRWRTLERRLLWGRWYEPVVVLGTGPHVAEVRALFPHLVRPELRRFPATRIPAAGLLRAAAHDAEAPEVDVVLALPHSRRGERNPRYSELLDVACAHAAALGLRMAVKEHPLESRGWAALDRHPDVLRLDRSASLEVLMLWSVRARAVCADTSTVLTAARWLFPDVRLLSVAPLLGRERERLRGVFDAIGVERCDAPGQLATFLAQLASAPAPGM